MDAHAIDSFLYSLLGKDPEKFPELTMLDILNDYLIRSPKARNKRVACHTTGRPARKFLTKVERKNGEEDQEKMVGVVYFPKLLDQSLRLAAPLLKKIVFSKTNLNEIVFVTYMSPRLTPSFCSPELFSEQDSREYCNAVYIRPALAAIQLVKGNGIPQNFICTDTSTDSYVTSGFKKKGSPIADNLLIKGPYKEVKGDVSARDDMLHEDARGQGHEGQFEVGDVLRNSGDEEQEEEDEEESDDAKLLGISPEVLMAMEMKTSTALTDSDFYDVLRFNELDRFKDAAYVMRFIWPEVKGQKINKCSKNFAQVYEQMYHSNKAEYAWLSSYDVNIFFYMKKGSRVMYMSDQYDSTKITPFHVFAWFCRANDLLEEDMKVPPPDETYFNLTDPNPMQAGLITGPMYEELSKELPDQPRTPKRGRDKSEDIPDILDNETTPTQRDFVRVKRMRKKGSKSNVD